MELIQYYKRLIGQSWQIISVDQADHFNKHGETPMEVATINQFRKNLQEKRQSLSKWFTATPVEQRKIHLGTADENQFSEHLHVIDGVIASTGEETFGLCDICHLNIGTQHLEMDYTASVCIDHFSEPEVRQLERELELAQSVQRALLPQKIPLIPGLELAAFSRPAQFVGGDFFDFIQFSDGAYGLIVADVAGHGVSAGLIMASLQTALRTLIPLNQDPCVVIDQLQHIYQHNINLTLFITLFLGRFDIATRRFSFVSAGHNPPLLISKTGRLTWLGPTGAAIGLVEGAQYRLETCFLENGDVLVFYTDGVTEAMNPFRQMFGEDRLAEAVAEQRHLPASQIVAGLRQHVETFTEDQPFSDDTTIVACKITS